MSVFLNCHYQGCNAMATCLPRLYVPASKLSANLDAEDVSALMGMPLCNAHFPMVTAEQLLADERGGAAIREGIARVFRERNAHPNFDKAVVGRVSSHDEDFKRFLAMQERARQN